MSDTKEVRINDADRSAAIRALSQGIEQGVESIPVQDRPRIAALLRGGGLPT